MNSDSKLKQQQAWSGAGQVNDGLNTNQIASQGAPTARGTGGSSQPDQAATSSTIPSLPKISVPTGGGAIQGIGEKFDVNPSTGTGSTSIPIRTSATREGELQPQLSLHYDSGYGNGPFGLGWQLSGVASITRKTSKGLPQYQDGAGDASSDVFLISDAEDLVPRFKVDAQGKTIYNSNGDPVIIEAVQDGFVVRRYSPRIEQTFLRVERWTSIATPEDVHWRVTSPQNRTTIFGSTSNSRIYDPTAGPDSPLRIFSWLAAETYDPHGNALIFNYKEENSVNVPVTQANEENRLRTANRYLASIQYGNTVPNRDPDTWVVSSAFALPPDNWKFSVVIDYGEYNVDFPQTTDSGPWQCRPDSFSDYHAGYEIRTYRLCQRILMFHHFSELKTKDCLIESTDFSYDVNPTASYLVSISRAGYTLDETGASYIKGVLAPTTFGYSLFPTDGELSGLTPQEVDSDNLENLPIGIDGSAYKWVDLDGQGLSGILSEQGDGWYFKGNTSANNTAKTGNIENIRPRLTEMERLMSRPSRSVNGLGAATFGDVSGAGVLDVIQHDAMCWGFYERIPEVKGWTSFRAFNQFPNIHTSDKGVNFMDLTGDGLADILIMTDQIYSWFPSLGVDGYGDASTVIQFLDASMAPVWVASDTENTIYVADMSGDGLMDIVRIRNGDICYWPNLGYAKFGSMVQMDNAPWFDKSDLFNENRIHLADIDGSGTTDIIYVGASGVDMYLNQSGNSFADRKSAGSFSPIDNTAVVNTLDLLGNGTSCIVWSSSLPSSGQAPLQYLDLMQGRKPHLLTQVINNLGAETRIHYTPSTKFYLDDADSGNPWLTRLPFPVHCVDRVEITDRIAQNRFVSTYSYHHGYFDGFEREFRGFGRVDRRDTEDFAAMNNTSSQNVDSSWHVPPTLTKTWFHTGVFVGAESISRHMVNEYFGSPPPSTCTNSGAMDTFLQNLLPDTVIPSTSLDTDALREVYRALKGSVLRQEVYTEDGGSKAGIPYSTQESNSSIEVIQPTQDSHAHSIYAVHPRESISYHFERDVDDPRIEHTMTLQVDAFGNKIKELHIYYGRTPGKSPLGGVDLTTQRTTRFMYSENDVTNLIDTATDYRTPIAFDKRGYELSGFSIPSGKTRLDFNDFTTNNFGQLSQLSKIPFEQENDPSKKQMRPISESRTIYRKDTLDAMLPPGQVEPLATPGADYQLCFTPGLLTQVFTRKISGQAQENLLSDPKGILSSQGQQGGGYIDLDSNGSWWKSTGQVYYHPDSSSTSSQELAEARGHFFTPRAFVDTFGNRSTVSYDSYTLQPTLLVDPIGNTTTVDIDYRTLAPKTITDPNGNRTAVAFDALGSVAGTAYMGKIGQNIGDSLDGFKADLTQVEIDAFFASPRGTTAIQLLGSASNRTVYDPTRYWRNSTSGGSNLNLPSYAAMVTRETHASDPVPVDGLKIQVSFAYSDGFGRVIQTKGQAKAGAVVGGGPIVQQRWIGSGWAIFNNKGDPVRKYEPFFDDTHDFKYNMQVGVSSIIMYDALSRPVVTLYPDHTFQKVVFSPWLKVDYDGGDNVLTLNPKDDADVGHLFDTLPDHEYLPAWYGARINGQLGPDEKSNAAKSAAYANTPNTSHFDSMGRPILSVQDNGSGNTFLTHVKLDILGQQKAVVDALNRTVATYDYNLCGEGIHQTSIEAGDRWSLNNATKQQLLSWNSRGFRFRTVYDADRRPIEVWVLSAGGNETLSQKTIWGEKATDSDIHNLRGKPFTVQDQAGTVVSSDYDFRGNLSNSSRQYAQNYKDDIDWSATVDLESSNYPASVSYDALNRPVNTTVADMSINFHGYNEGGHLDQVFVNIKGENTSTHPLDWTAIVNGVEHNAKNQMVSINYGNGVSRTFAYDPLRFRLTSLITTRPSNGNPLQTLGYVYDPVGNTTHIRDHAQQTIYFRNKRVDPTCDYIYDPLYRLISASGREHLGQVSGGGLGPTPPQALMGITVDQPGDGNAMGIYTESYTYDGCGNLLSVSHAGSDPKTPGWTRTYAYAEASSLEPLKKSNRLSRTTVGSTTDTYQYDEHGNITSMPHLTLINWDYQDTLRATSRQRVNDGVPETTYYRYDGTGNRIRKVTERQASASASTPGNTAPTKMKERLYLSGGLEVYREYAAINGTAITLERTDFATEGEGIKRIVLIQSRTQGTDSGPTRILRYQLDNQLGSATVELDEQALVLSYEEFFPYGGSSYQAVRSDVQVPKRYRFCGKERDEESGFDYCGARYYAPWLGRWTSCDPAGLVDGPNLYVYVKSNPVRYDDPGGRQAADKQGGTLPSLSPDAFKLNPSLAQLKVKPEEKIDPPNAWSATISQSLSIMPKDSLDREASVSGTISGSLNVKQPLSFTGGFQSALHKQIAGVEDVSSVDLGFALGLGGSKQGGDNSRTAFFGVPFHAALRLGDKDAPFGLAIYEQPGGSVTKESGKHETVGATATTTFVGSYDHESGHFSSAVINLSPNYAQSGSLPSGPVVPNMFNMSVAVGIGLNWGKKIGVTFEGTGSYNFSAGGSGSAQTPTAWSARAGGVLSLNKLFMTGGNTDSLSIGLWAGPDIVKGSSPLTTFSTTLGISYSYRGK